MKATTLLGMTITEASGKIRTGGVHDNPDDSQERVWAGVLGVETRFTDVTPDTDTPVLVEVSENIRRLLGKAI
jgi:hypothetical protein